MLREIAKCADRRATVKPTTLRSPSSLLQPKHVNDISPRKKRISSCHVWIDSTAVPETMDFVPEIILTARLVSYGSA